MSESINVAILLHPSWRTSEGVARVQDIASTLGIQLTTGGKTSLSGKISPEVFVQLFGVEPTPVVPTPPGRRDFGAPGGYTSEGELRVPAELAEYVEAISIVPPATRMNRSL